MTHWLDEQEQQAWRGLAAVLELVPGVLDSQLTRDHGLTHFDYLTLAMLSEAPARTLRMGTLAGTTNASLARLSHVVRRLQGRGLVRRRPAADDGRATDVELTEQGWAVVQEAAPGHVATVRATVLDPLTSEQVVQLAAICEELLERLDPERRIGRRGRPPG